MTDLIINHLKNQRKSFQLYTRFSDQPGIYAFFFHGSDFPLVAHLPKEDEIVYIGKTLSSEESRSLKTHFSSGRTGSSTVRRTFGALLRNQLGLKPVPRNLNGSPSSNFKFDDFSEKKLSKWMQENLALSFYPYPRTSDEIELLEKSLIINAVPVLNLKDNPGNSFLSTIKLARKVASDLANENGFKAYSEKTLVGHTKTPFGLSVGKQGLYTSIWQKYRTDILSCMGSSKVSHSIQLNANLFSMVGNRKDYRFRLEIWNGRINNNIGGSAVARDLAKVLLNSPEVKRLGILVIRMDINFILEVSAE